MNWISVKDCPPRRAGRSEQTAEVLVAYRSGSGYIVTAARAAWFNDEIAWKGVPTPTHWMPMPPPPPRMTS